MANEDKPKQDYSSGLQALSSPVPDAAKEPGNEKARGTMAQKTCPKCPGSPVMNAAPVIVVIPAMNDERFVNVKKISETAGLPVEAYECPLCHLVELYRPS
jgi:hypothetical protein